MILFNHTSLGNCLKCKQMLPFIVLMSLWSVDEYVYSFMLCQCASCSSRNLPTPPVFGHWCLFLFRTFLTCGTTHHCQVLLWAGSNVESTGLFLWVALSVLHVGYVCSVADTSKKKLFYCPFCSFMSISYIYIYVLWFCIVQVLCDPLYDVIVIIVLFIVYY